MFRVANRCAHACFSRSIFWTVIREIFNKRVQKRADFNIDILLVVKGKNLQNFIFSSADPQNRKNVHLWRVKISLKSGLPNRCPCDVGVSPNHENFYSILYTWVMQGKYHEIPCMPGHYFGCRNDQFQIAVSQKVLGVRPSYWCQMTATWPIQNP